MHYFRKAALLLLANLFVVFLIITKNGVKYFYIKERQFLWDIDKATRNI